MRHHFTVIAVAALLFSIGIFFWAKSAVHEILAAIAFLIAVVAWGLGRLMDLGADLRNILGQMHTAQQKPIAVTVAAPTPATLPPLPGKERYYLGLDDQIGGPYPLDQVREILSKDARLQGAYVIREGDTAWQPGTSLKS